MSAGGVYRLSRKAEAAHADAIWSVAWNPSTNLIVTGSADETVKVWSPAELSTTRLIREPEVKAAVVGVATSLSGTIAAASSLDGNIRVFDLSASSSSGDEKKAESSHLIEAGSLETWTIALSPNGELLASGTHQGGVNIFSTKDSKEPKKAALQSDSKFTMSVAYAPNGSMLASGGYDGAVHVFDTETAKSIQKFSTHVKPVRGLAFSPDSGLLFAVSDDQHISIYETKGLQQIALLSGHQSWVLGVAVHPSGQQFATCGFDRKVRIWDLRSPSRDCLHTFDAHKEAVWSLAYSPDGKQLASVGDDGALVIYDTIL